MKKSDDKNSIVLEIHKPKPKFPVLKEIQDRFSPRFFSDKKIPKKDLNSILEAARWAPSGHNMQPWYFHIFHKGSKSYQKLFSTLHEYNQSWAYSAPVLILGSIIEKKDDSDESFGKYDLGAAVMSMILQAESMGYYSRQMAWFDKDKAKELFDLDPSLKSYIIVAMGKMGDFNQAPDEVFEYELDARPRKEKIFEVME